MLCLTCQRQSLCLVYRIANQDKMLQKGLGNLKTCEMRHLTQKEAH